MNSFDATSGTIDALLAVAIYAGLVFGIRAIVHRVRHTEANPGNNKWMWLSALGIAGAVLVGSGMSGTTAAEAGPDRCTQVRKAMTDLEALPQDTQAQKNWMGLRASHVVVNDPQCFDPGLVANAQAYIIKSR